MNEPTSNSKKSLLFKDECRKSRVLHDKPIRGVALLLKKQQISEQLTRNQLPVKRF
jgi:hypothetical protein